MPRGADQDTYDAVDAFVEATLLGLDPPLEAANAEADAAGLPAIQVSPAEARLLAVLCGAVGARRILEFGTLAGYSTIALARALPEDGTLVTLEYDAGHAEVAWANIERAGFAAKVDLRVGAALETLPLLESEAVEPFDFVFIDADKINTAPYFAWSLDHTRPGGLIFVDNVVRHGGLVDPEADAASVAQRDFLASLADEPRVTATTIQTVGVKGHDGFVLAIVNR